MSILSLQPYKLLSIKTIEIVKQLKYSMFYLISNTFLYRHLFVELLKLSGLVAIFETRNGNMNCTYDL